MNVIFTDASIVYTWFPEGKVVFVAPTKPLVAQQIEACHKTCGIPGSHAAELTGQNARQVRAKAVCLSPAVSTCCSLIEDRSGKRSVYFT